MYFVASRNMINYTYINQVTSPASWLGTNNAVEIDLDAHNIRPPQLTILQPGPKGWPLY